MCDQLLRYLPLYLVTCDLFTRVKIEISSMATIWREQNRKHWPEFGNNRKRSDLYQVSIFLINTMSFFFIYCSLSTFQTDFEIFNLIICTHIMEIDTLSYARKNSALSTKTLPWLPRAVWHKHCLQKPGIISAAVRAYMVQCHNKWDKDIFLEQTNSRVVCLIKVFSTSFFFFFLKSLRKKHTFTTI